MEKFAQFSSSLNEFNLCRFRFENKLPVFVKILLLQNIKVSFSFPFLSAHITHRSLSATMQGKDERGREGFGDSLSFPPQIFASKWISSSFRERNPLTKQASTILIKKNSYKKGKSFSIFHFHKENWQNTFREMKTFPLLISSFCQMMILSQQQASRQ